MRNCSDKKTLAYLGLFFVVLIWGTSPLVTQHFYKYYSPCIRAFFVEIILFVSYIIMGSRHLKEFNIDYIKIGIPTGFFLALANISQKVGLMYTTPARYAFLENLSCIAVPVMMYFVVKKKPGIMTVISCATCFASVFILNGVSFNDSSWGIGEVLCALSGILYGFNIVGTGVFAKKLRATLYLAVQSVVGMSVSLAFALTMNFITVPNSEGIRMPLEKIMFSFKIEHLLFTIVYIVISNAFCWVIRTNAMKHIHPSVVSVIMPFSAVVTGVLSVLMGKDVLDFNLVAGGLLGSLAVILSGFGDSEKK